MTQFFSHNNLLRNSSGSELNSTDLIFVLRQKSISLNSKYRNPRSSLTTPEKPGNPEECIGECQPGLNYCDTRAPAYGRTVRRWLNSFLRGLLWQVRHRG